MHLLRFSAIIDFFSVILRNNFFYEIQNIFSPFIACFVELMW
jgi:hypothetical protein